MLRPFEMAGGGCRHVLTLCFFLVFTLSPSAHSMGDNQQDAPSGFEHDSTPSQNDPVDEPVQGDINQREMYQKLFTKKREAQQEAVQSIIKMDKYEKQYKMVKTLLSKMFTTLTDAQVKLRESGFSNDENIPVSEEIRDAFSMVLENTAFFGDLLLFLPDVTHDLLKRNKDWDLSARWALSFCRGTGLMHGTDDKLLNLMEQELGIIEKDPNYFNPYRKDNLEMAKKQKEREALAERERLAKHKEKKKEEKKKKRKRGPSLSAHHNEL